MGEDFVHVQHLWSNLHKNNICGLLFPLLLVFDSICASQVDGIPVGDESRCLAVSITAAEGKNEVEAMPDEAPQRIFEAQDVVLRGLADTEDRADIIQSDAAEMANVSQVPSSSTSVEKVEDLVGSTARMQVSKESEAVVGGDGMDVTRCCSAAPETASIDGVSTLCSSEAGSEHVESLSEKDLVGHSIVKLDTKESEAGVTNQGNQIVQGNEVKDMEHVESFSEKDLVGNSVTTLDTKQSEAGVTYQENQIVQDSELKDMEHVESSSEKDLVGNSEASLEAKESEAGVTNQENQVEQENASKDVEKSPPSAAEGRIEETSSEKGIPACSEIQQESKECEIEDGKNIVQDSQTVNEKAPEKDSVKNSVVGEAEDSKTEQ